MPRIDTPIPQAMDYYCPQCNWNSKERQPHVRVDQCPECGAVGNLHWVLGTRDELDDFFKKRKEL